MSADGGDSGESGDSDREHGDSVDAGDTAEDAAADTPPETDAPHLLRRRETAEGTLVAVCDADVLGETFTDGAVSLEVTEEFYGGEEAVPADADAVIEGLYDADTANLVGEECVGVAVEAGLVDAERVLEVEDTLHAQLLWL